MLAEETRTTVSRVWLNGRPLSVLPSSVSCNLPGKPWRLEPGAFAFSIVPGPDDLAKRENVEFRIEIQAGDREHWILTGASIVHGDYQDGTQPGVRYYFEGEPWRQVAALPG